ncbi:MAG: Ferric uptake regulator, Fur family [Synergistales bacterium 57_84]|nr:MAG: Ferric uptake regulator, Fur family [Synergistales bacterium 57_84]
MWTIEDGIERIRSRGLKITSQRIAILKLLKGRKDHPSAEKIFREMKKTYPTISFATIYSTAQILQDAGLLQILTIDEHRVFFDPNPHPHAPHPMTSTPSRSTATAHAAAAGNRARPPQDQGRTPASTESCSGSLWR